MKKLILATLFLAFIIPAPTFSAEAQYENYVWGTKKEEALKKVGKNGYAVVANMTLEKNGQELIGYKDEIFSNDVNVALHFTPITKQLSTITIKSKSGSLGRELKPILTKKYGSPIKVKKYSDKYAWLNSTGKRPILILDYNKYKTSIYYYSVEFYSVFEKEQKELNEKEAKGKF